MTAQLSRIVYRIGSPENDQHHFTEQKDHADIAKNNGYEVSEYVLAGMDSEPVAYIFKHPSGKLFWALTDESNKGRKDVMPVYAAQPVPVASTVPDGLRMSLSNAGIAAPESDEVLFATHEKYVQLLVDWVKDRKPFTSAPVAVPDEGREQFEAWVKFHLDDERSIVTLHRANGGLNYRDPHVDLAWIAWKESRAAMLNAGPVTAATVPDGWTANADANDALVMLDRIDTVDCDDDERIESVKKIIRRLAIAPVVGNFRENENSSTNNFRENSETSTKSHEKCWCRTCRPGGITDMRFVVCPDCGNKRCPHANDHRNACSGSNEPWQVGSACPAAPEKEV